MNWLGIGRRVLKSVAGSQRRPTTPTATRRTTVATERQAHGGRQLEYAPNLDGAADPGEIVWTWVPYEEDASRGKDRPVLVVGRDRGDLLGLMLSSNSDREGQRNWLALGAGAWDGRHRPSWIRLDRVLLVPENGIRREGAILDRERFGIIADELRRSFGWQ